MRRRGPTQVVTDAFNEVALLIGGAAAVNDLPDELLWRMLRSLKRIRTRTCRSLGDSAPSASPSSLGPLPCHPAVEAFLSASPDHEEPR